MILMFVLILGILNTTFATNALTFDGYPVARLGQVLLGDYLVPFEIISVLLLVVMIGAAYLAKGRRRETPQRPTNPQLARQAREWS
jgi:NADH:ubiquinone oxidoreductase subunit 6 (subunit J)